MNKKFIAQLLVTILFFGVSIAIATTTITDNEITTTGDVNASNLLYGNLSGNFNETVGGRLLTTNGNLTLTVCNSGCNYTTIQGAVNRIPYILRHPVVIQVYDGTYNEDVYIPPMVISFTSVSEGSVRGLYLIGNLSNYNAVKVRSFQITGGVGSISTKIRGLQITGQEPRSDENVSVSVYGTQGVELQDINFTGTVDYAFLAYTSRINGNRLFFNGNQQHAAQAKNMGTIIFGDSSGGNANNGTVQGELVKSDDGSYIFIQANGVQSSAIIQANGESLVLDSDTNTLYNVGNLGKNATFTNLVDVFVNDSVNYGLELKNVASGSRALRMLDSSGTAVLIGTGSQFQILGNYRLNIASNTTSKSCTAGTTGDIYYDGTVNKHFGCNSTTWNALY